MGFIADTARSKNTVSQARDRGRSLWMEVFGGMSRVKEEPSFPPVRGGSYGRSVVSESAAQKRLLQAYRSKAPGGWTDDRYEQSKHLTDIRYICSHRVGELMMQSEFQVFQKDDLHPDGKRPVLKGEPGYRLVELLERPNNDDTFGEFIYAVNQQLDLTGMALTWMVPNLHDAQSPKGQSICELYVVPTAVAIPQPAINPDYPNGYYRIQPLYPYGPFSSYPAPSTSVGAPIAAEWMMRCKYTHPLLRYDGYSPQTGMRLILDEIEQMDKSRWYQLKRLVSPSAMLNMKDVEGFQGWQEDELERMRADFENEVQGPENSGRLFVPPPGAFLEPWETNLRELQYTESWEQLVGMAMAALGISKEAAGMIGSTAYAQLWASIKQLHLLTLVPKCYRIAAKLTRCVAPFFGDDLIVEIKPPRIDDHEVTFQKIGLMASGKFGTKNEARKMLELPVTQKPWGEDILGDPSPKEEQQMQQQQAAAGGGEGGENPLAALGDQGPMAEQKGPEEEAPLNEQVSPAEERQLEPPEITRGRPKTGKLGAGSLGPRKSLILNGRYQVKSFYDQVMETISNGHS